MKIVNFDDKQGTISIKNCDDNYVYARARGSGVSLLISGLWHRVSDPREINDVDSYEDLQPARVATALNNAKNAGGEEIRAFNTVKEAFLWIANNV